MKEKHLLTVISTIILCVYMLSTVAFAPAVSVKEAPTIKYILDDDGGHRVSDEEFYAKFEVTDMRTVGSVASFADEQAQEAEKPMLRFYLGTDGLYKLSEAQFQEAISETSSFPDVISRDGLTPLVVEESANVVNLEEKCKTQDALHIAYISNIDFSKANSFTVSVVDAQTHADDGLSVQIPLSTLILSVEELRLDGDRLIAIGNVNPSLQVYQEFNIETQELIHEYYGYGFVTSGENVIFIQAPQHFNGISGHNMIVSSNGCLLYESGEDKIIRNNLKIEGSILSFEEMNLTAGEITEKTLNIDGPVIAKNFVSYYD